MDLAYFQILRTPTFAAVSVRGCLMVGFEQAGSGSTFNVASRSLRQYPPGDWPPRMMASGFNLVPLPGGWRLDLPYYFVLPLVMAVAAAPWLRWRFSLRTLLISTTVMALALGLIVALTRYH
jgi:hypothetical protein